METLCDKLFILHDNFNSLEISKTLDLLTRLDIEEFYKDEIIYSKAKVILKTLEQFPSAKKIYTTLKNKNSTLLILTNTIIEIIVSQ